MIYGLISGSTDKFLFVNTSTLTEITYVLEKGTQGGRRGEGEVTEAEAAEGKIINAFAERLN